MLLRPYSGVGEGLMVKDEGRTVVLESVRRMIGDAVQLVMVAVRK